ncbi:binding-protein-dependent transport systems inner membrane component [Beutenbergia cavernae DSM 12333]|uniref:Oligopeptide transport system permease protein OppC n=1 Tax=Beutenbergia cavernae (strain ATCC BAA-8 / DSM 12333 / CCUG 43141 / JCM 11478 / NBRC 16432 / NCIMB 13614 / HKI 0122) TaxID=471853 RepID=C5C0X4_BEUC1|nr:ABC transporter permease [Beutenbergia cavernae]ACQ79378.1 binding-protein-dependent transport systems inner membrane component [Beutenbergia cavernae DSM 12333]
MSNETPEPTASGSQDQLENALELRETEGLSQGQIVRRRFLRHRGAVIGLVVFLLIVLLAFTSIGVGGWTGWWPKNAVDRYPVLAGGSPTLEMPAWLGGPGFAIGEHPFGQDEIGRDVFARTMRGTQTSIIVMVVLGFVATTVGIVVGALSGYFRGKADQTLMRLTDLIIILPAIVIGAVLGKQFGGADPVPLALILGLVIWPGLARLVRGEFLSLREREFVDAARVAGASSGRIIFKHMLPNAMGVIIVNTTLMLSTAILLETSLSYLGFGITQPNVSLGYLISEYQSAFSTRPWLFWWPGLFIVSIALCVNFVGDGLRDAFDPRQKRIPSERKMARAARRQAARAGAGAPGQA